MYLLPLCACIRNCPVWSEKLFWHDHMFSLRCPSPSSFAMLPQHYILQKGAWWSNCSCIVDWGVLSLLQWFWDNNRARSFRWLRLPVSTIGLLGVIDGLSRCCCIACWFDHALLIWWFHFQHEWCCAWGRHSPTAWPEPKCVTHTLLGWFLVQMFPRFDHTCWCVVWHPSGVGPVLPLYRWIRMY